MLAEFYSVVPNCKRSAAVLKGNTVTAKIPEDACCYFVELRSMVNGIPLISSTALIEKENVY